jgi:hypothetical protein
VLIDNSISTGLKDASGDRKILLKTAIENSKFSDISQKNLKVSIFDTEVKLLEDFKENNINNSGQMTDISKAIKWINSNAEQDNIQAVLLITDGAFNTGSNPIYDADVLGKPIYTIGIGDSTEPKDVSIQSIITNDIAYIDNSVPVNVNIKVSGYQQGSLTLKLLDNGNLISTQNFNINPDKDAFTSIFEYLPKTEGIHKITATVSALENEITLKNNSLSEFINVLKNKRQIAIFAGAPSPDLSFIKNTISSEKGVEVKAFIQKKGIEFYDKTPTEADLKQSEMIIFIDFPISSTPDNVMQMLRKELERGKPLFFVAAQNTDYIKLRILEDFLPFTTISTNQKEFLALPDVKAEESANPLLRVTSSSNDIDLWNQLPPLFRTETFVKVKPESEVVAGIKVNNAPLKEPLILMRSFGNKKSIVVLGYGLYRWKLLGYAADVSKGRTGEADLFDIFIQNSMKWLSIKQDNKLVNIKTTKKVYANTEKIEFIGQIYDASYNPLENATVQIKVSGGNQTKDLTLTSAGNGRYTGQIDGMPEGDYYFTGIAQLNGTNLGSDKGRFNVGELSLEYLNLKMNAPLLRNLSERTGGKFYTPANCSSFLDDLKNKKSFIPRSVTIRNEFALWNIAWLLALAIFCFALEWFLRKRAGML